MGQALRYSNSILPQKPKLPPLRGRVIHLKHPQPWILIPIPKRIQPRPEKTILPHSGTKGPGDAVLRIAAARNQKSSKRHGIGPLKPCLRPIQFLCECRSQDLHGQRIFEDQRPRVVHLVRRSPKRHPNCRS